MDEMISTVGNNALVLDTAEDTLTQEASLIEQKAQSVVVASDADYAVAGDLTKAVKQMQKKIKDYWEPMRVSAKKAYDDILAHKKEMLDPLEAAEKILKGKMGDYSMEKERRRRVQEEAMRRLAQQEMDRKLEEAARAEAAGDTVGAEFAMTEAEVLEGVSISGGIKSQTPKADGVSQTKAWKITGIDSGKVPVSFGGVEIRPVDEKAVMRLIKESKGTIQIPGIQYEETVSISVQA
ncbi:hypothetical protein [Anaerotruncus colihominis]|uniref:hypothetical protein n=1 Tax=Anaerotruncus colihominis TaxID=169435 RepID=UPI00242EF310|nr:hypothetical protein [Anaerotruncus colihominis]